MYLEGAKIYFEGRHKSETVVVNYSSEDVQMALRAANEDGNAAGMTQEKFHCEDSDKNEDGIASGVMSSSQSDANCWHDKTRLLVNCNPNFDFRKAIV